MVWLITCLSPELLTLGQYYRKFYLKIDDVLWSGIYDKDVPICQHCLVKIIGIITWVKDLSIVKVGQKALSKVSPPCVDFGLLGAEVLCLYTCDGWDQEIDWVLCDPIQKREGKETCVCRPLPMFILLLLLLTYTFCLQ